MRIGRDLLHYGLMWCIRYAPVPKVVKDAAIWWTSPRMVVVTTALIPDAAGRLLLVRARYSGRWILPGGALHPGELPLAALRRECREELGQDVTVRGLVGVVTTTPLTKLFFVFDCAPLPAPPQLSAEHEVYRYVPLEMFPPQLRLLVERAQRWGRGALLPVAEDGKSSMWRRK